MEFVSLVATNWREEAKKFAQDYLDIMEAKEDAAFEALRLALGEA